MTNKCHVYAFFRCRSFISSLSLALAVLLCPSIRARQLSPADSPAPEPQRNDALGRTTPRGTVLGFLSAARKGNNEVAAEYLNTKLRGKAAANLAHQLFVVLDRKLPAKLNELSTKPEGSVPNPLEPNTDRVGTVSSSIGNVDILLERVEIAKVGYGWLFSSKTLQSIPELYEQVNAAPTKNIFPEFLTARLMGVALFEWLAILVGLPFLYLMTWVLNRVLSRLAGASRRYWHPRDQVRDPEVLPMPARFLLIAGSILWLASRASLSLLARQFWSTTATIILIVCCVWLFIRLNGRTEEFLCRLLVLRKSTGIASFSKLVRRLVDVLAVFVGMLIGLKHFGFSPTAALAGLGVGGIAIALAAQKTLENVIGGVSVIFDQTVRVGDVLKLGDTCGIVEDIGLRSTCIRTPDRTVVSVPNGQIANESLENLSLRDKFWFHPHLYLRHDTTPAQLRSVLEGVIELLSKHPHVDDNSLRVTLLSVGFSGLELEVSAYLRARDWNSFLEIQGELQINILEVLEAAGTYVAPQLAVNLPEPANEKSKPKGVNITH